jgi:HEAT repeat protein
VSPAELRELMHADAETRARRVTEVVALLARDQRELVCGALELLGHWRETESQPLPFSVLARARNLTEHDHARVRATASAALALLTPAEAVAASAEVLEARLRDPAWEVRAEAAAALGDLGAGDSALEPLLQDSVAEVRFEAAFALGALGSSAALPSLMGFLSDRRRRADAIEGLHRLGDPAAIPGLKRWVGSWRLGWVERHALDAALVALGDAEARPRLRRACEKGRFERRAYAFHLAGRVGLEEAEPALWRALEGRDEDLWGPAVEALRAMGRAEDLRRWATEAPAAQAALIRSA